MPFRLYRDPMPPPPVAPPFIPSTSLSPVDLGGKNVRRRFRQIAILALTLLFLAAPLRADSISGTVKDPSGAGIPAAKIEISGPTLPQPLLLTSDDAGKFSAPNLS